MEVLEMAAEKGQGFLYAGLVLPPRVQADRNCQNLGMPVRTWIMSK